ncbi:peptidase M23 [Aliifodinibius salipaludis]|uniref:Peptidase M23 n=1 Tax=Fodinibius salipaludis TaxID=2032627 RepID=A0A2A2G706_9BACT|nr:peptidoglycan DD-metalloendopeptidase family protein [Aliifodinibius salipaludis]PAU93546.1 peptidase M23 [Aliifodinibius salipaludis]
MNTYSDYNFGKVMDYPDNRDALYLFDFSQGYDADFIRSKEWGIGKYNEKRSNMYLESMFHNERNVHMGIDIWTQTGAPVFSFWDGEVAYIQNNDQPGDYGPTIVIKYELNDSPLYALYGHLSEEALEMVSVGEAIKKGQKIATLGSQGVNGGWAPHLHFQLSVEDPQEADMPGVVAPENREEALQTFPDPRIVLGDLY